MFVMFEFKEGHAELVRAGGTSSQEMCRCAWLVRVASLRTSSEQAQSWEGWKMFPRSAADLPARAKAGGLFSS